jgi:hypothetical protein
MTGAAVTFTEVSVPAEPITMLNDSHIANPITIDLLTFPIFI